MVAPGSPFSRDALSQGVLELERMGYSVRYRDDIFSADGFFAGSHERRTSELLEALADPAIHAVICARGGYGSNYVAQALDQVVLAAPKIVMGYSDITALHLALWRRERWVTFHGPMLTIDFPGRAVWQQAVSSTRPWQAGRAQVLRSGQAEGILLGGCLSILAASLGTWRESDFDGAVLFLEDLDERPYRVDRMLFHLREAGKLKGVRGIVFGEMKGCKAREGEAPLEEVILAAIPEIPILYGFPSGHTSGENICLPFGVRAAISGDTLALLEGAVT